MNFIAIATIVLLMAFSGTSYASEKTRQLTGEITAFDAKAGILSVKGKKGELSCTTSAETKIREGKEARTAESLKQGVSVTVKYAENDGRKSCVSVGIKTEEASAGTKTAGK